MNYMVLYEYERYSSYPFTVHIVLQKILLSFPDKIRLGHQDRLSFPATLLILCTYFHTLSPKGTLPQLHFQGNVSTLLKIVRTSIILQLILRMELGATFCFFHNINIFLISIKYKSSFLRDFRKKKPVQKFRILLICMNIKCLPTQYFKRNTIDTREIDDNIKNFFYFIHFKF